MKKFSFATSLLCSALLFGCGDDKGEQTSGNTGVTGATGKTSDDTNGMSSSDTNDATTGPTTGQSSNSDATSSASGPNPTTDDPGESTGASFIKPSDGGTGGTKECDQWTQDCKDGEKCMPYSGDGDSAWESLKCVPVMPNAGAVGEPCTVEGSGVSGLDSCEKGAMCWNVDQESGMGVCVEQCKGSPDAPKCNSLGTSCLNANDGVLTLCLPQCDPLVQDCEGNDLCVPNPQDPNSFICVLDASGEEGQEWDVCEYANACDKGMLCANPALAKECDPMGKGCCLPFCDINDPQCKGAGQSCLPWYEEGQAPPGFEVVGVCGIPQ